MASILNVHLPTRVTDSSGRVEPGSKLYVYDAGTTTDADVYQDNALSSAHPQPIVANSGGRFGTIYCEAGQLYKIVLVDANDDEIFTIDNLTPYISGDGATLPVTGGGTGATTAAGARTNLGAASQADMTTVTSTLSDIDSELSGIGGSLGSLAAQDTLDATDFGTDLDDVVVQEVRKSTSAQSTLSSAQIPLDSSVPQRSEGVEVLSQSFTPKRTDTIIRIKALVVMEQTSTVLVGILAAFVSTADNALAAVPARMQNANPEHFVLWAEHNPSTLDPITYSLRAGCSTARDIKLNSNYLGGACVSEMVIQEIYSPS